MQCMIHTNAATLPLTQSSSFLSRGAPIDPKRPSKEDASPNKTPGKEAEAECVKEYVYVDFNAWEYAASDELWAGLIRALYAKVESRIKRQPAPLGCREGHYKRVWRATRAV